MSPNVAPSISSENKSRANGDTKADGRDDERRSIGSSCGGLFQHGVARIAGVVVDADRAFLGKVGGDFLCVRKRLLGLIVGTNLAATEFLAVHAIGIFDNRPVDRIP